VTDKAQQRQIEALAALIGVQEQPPTTAPQLWRVTTVNGDDTYDLAAVWDADDNQTTRVREDVPAINDTLEVADTCILVAIASAPRTLHAWRPGVGAQSCDECDPALPDIIYVTISGLTGDYAGWNGKNTLDWWTGCTWSDSTEYPRLTLTQGATGWWLWAYTADPLTNYIAWWAEAAPACDPIQTYSFAGLCAGAGCAAANQNATITVSYT
jgi:hypothetical protein